MLDALRSGKHLHGLCFSQCKGGGSRWSLAESSGALSVTLIPSAEICLLQLRTAICFQPIHQRLKQLEHFALNRTATLVCVAQFTYRCAIKPSEVGFNHTNAVGRVALWGPYRSLHIKYTLEQKWAFFHLTFGLSIAPGLWYPSQSEERSWKYPPICSSAGLCMLRA